MRRTIWICGILEFDTLCSTCFRTLYGGDKIYTLQEIDDNKIKSIPDNEYSICETCLVKKFPKVF